MKIVMTSFMSDGKKLNLNPGDIVDTDDKKCQIDAEEAQRLLDVGGARRQTEAEIEAERKAAEPRTDGPTVAEYVAKGYKASGYPPAGYASRSTPDEIAAAIAAEKK
jgi:hypothetical protein